MSIETHVLAASGREIFRSNISASFDITIFGGSTGFGVPGVPIISVLELTELGDSEFGDKLRLEFSEVRKNEWVCPAE